jgi:hypothetical protein
MYTFLRLPSYIKVSPIIDLAQDNPLTLEPTAYREERGIHGSPSDQDAKI